MGVVTLAWDSPHSRLGPWRPSPLSARPPSAQCPARWAWSPTSSLAALARPDCCSSRCNRPRRGTPGPSRAAAPASNPRCPCSRGYPAASTGWTSSGSALSGRRPCRQSSRAGPPRWWALRGGGSPATWPAPAPAPRWGPAWCWWCGRWSAWGSPWTASRCWWEWCRARWWRCWRHPETVGSWRGTEKRTSM